MKILRNWKGHFNSRTQDYEIKEKVIQLVTKIAHGYIKINFNVVQLFDNMPILTD